MLRRKKRLVLSVLTFVIFLWTVSYISTRWESFPTIYVITPTHTRPVQKADLTTRLLLAFRAVKNIHWIVVEDSDKKTRLVANLLSNSGLAYTHLNIPTPEHMKRKSNQKQWSKPRGVLQRNEGLRWLRAALEFNQDLNAYLYFADDDNAYDPKLFDEIRTIKKAGVWPVAFVGELMVEKPLVEDGRVVGWDVAIKPEREFAVDMAGFAVSVKLLMDNPEARFDFDQPVGYQETYFLKSLRLKKDDLELKARNCTEVLVWHTRTEKVNLIQEKIWNRNGKRSDFGIEV